MTQNFLEKFKWILKASETDADSESVENIIRKIIILKVKETCHFLSFSTVRKAF
jgi:hypothetical protein